MANQPKKYTKFVAAAATATLVASAIVPVASAAGFSDVADTNSHAVNINALAEAGIIGGYPDGTFKPNQELTRGQVVKMLGKWVEAQGFEIPADYATKARFTDLAADAKDQELVKYAALVFDTGVFAGSNGALNAGGKITRENMALVLDRAFKAINDTTLVEVAADIEDVKIADLNTAKAEAREAIQALRNLGISGVENFMPKDSVTRAQFASFLNKTIKTEAAPVELTVKEAVAVDANTVEVTLSDDKKHTVKLEKALEANKATEIKFSIDEKEYTAEVTFVVEELLVEEVKAVNAKTLEVKFNKAVEDISKVTFEVKRGTANVSLTPTWSEDKKSVKLASATNLIAGDYTVTIKGASEEVLTGTVKVEAVKVNALNVTSTVLYDATAKAPVNVELLDQYGEKLALNNSDFTYTAYNKTQGVEATVQYDATSKSFFIKTDGQADAFKVGDVISVTFIHNATGLTVTKEVKVVAASTLDAITFGKVELPKDKTVLTESLTDVKVAYTAVDQYGEEVTINPADVEIVSSNTDILSKSDVTFVTEDKVNKVKIAKFGKEGKVTLTLLSKASGKTATVTLDVQPAAGKITTVELAETSGTVAASSTKTVALAVKDNYGSALKVADYRGEFSFSSTNVNVVANADIEINAKGELEFDVLSTATKGNSTTISVLNAGKVVATYVVTAGEVAVPTSIDFDTTSKHNTKLAVGAETSLVFTAFDQYGTKLVSDNAAYSVKYTVKNSSTNVSLNKTTDANEAANTLNVTADKVGNAVVLVELLKGTETVASKEVSFQVIENSSSDLAVSDIAVLAAGDSTEYREEVKVATISGAALPSSSIVNVVSSNPEVAKVTEVDGKWYVTGVATNKDVNNNSVDTKATLTVVYNATDKPVTLTKEVTVSATPVAPIAVNLLDKTLTATGQIDKTAVTVTSTTVDTFADLTSEDIFASITDNYGRNTVADTTDLTSNLTLQIQNAKGYTAGTSADTITVDSDGKLVFNGFEDNLISVAGEKASFRILATTKTGAKIGYVDVTVNGGTTVLAAANSADVATAKSTINALNIAWTTDAATTATAATTAITAATLPAGVTTAVTTPSTGTNAGAVVITITKGSATDTVVIPSN
ncbi:S-layer homology domain-containing protein [Solibacillus isronensis]|uniref:S-layer homology domain-containing protein n=1 Tax=Solibacillus isronensis TaxID=412383 RepID=UPI0039A0A913